MGGAPATCDRPGAWPIRSRRTDVGKNSGTCSIAFCGRDAAKRGWCQTHYARWRTTGVTGGPIRRSYSGITCEVAACDEPASCRDLCRLHYSRWRKKGDPLDPGTRIIRDDLRRIGQYINRDGPVPARRPDLGPCWIWCGSFYKNGYGKVYFQGRTRLAHRVAYMVFVGEITNETIDHLCSRPSCVNPSHMEPVSLRENVQRGGLNGVAAINAAKTHCPKGHPYSPENTVFTKNGHHRACRICSKTSRELSDAKRNAR